MVGWKLGAAAVAAALLGGAGSASAATLTLDYTGTASSITDPNDMFDLDGATSAAFDVKYVFDLSKGIRVSCCGGADEVYGGSNFGVASPLLDATLTINGHTIDFPGGAGDEDYLQPGVYDEAFSDTGATGWEYSHILMSGNTGATLETAFSASGSGSGNFFICDPAAAVCNSQINTVGGNYSPTNLVATVPEPAAWALMLGGLGMVGAGARLSRRRHGAALAAG